MASSAPRYARAFAEVAEAASLDVSRAQQQLNDFAETLAGSDDLREFLGNPSIELAQKLKVLDAISVRLGMFQQVRNFVAVILEHHRLDELGEIIAGYGEIADADAGAVEVKITSSRVLNDTDRAQLEAQVGKLAGAKVRASYAEDASLIGGAVVEIGSTIYNGSVKAQLEALKQMLVNA